MKIKGICKNLQKSIKNLSKSIKNKTKFYINVQNIHRSSLQELNLGKKLSASFDINDLIILEK